MPTKISVKPSAKSINSGQAAIARAGSSLIDIQLTDASGKGIADKKLTIIATRGHLQNVSSADTPPTNTRTIGGTGGDELTFSGTAGTLPDDTSAQAGSVTTTADADAGGTADNIDSAGYARVKLVGAGSPGVATITVTIGDVTGTASVVLHGAAKTITAEAEHGAIEQGGKTFIVVTATDSAGNPVANHNVNVKSDASGVVGPAKGATEVTTSNTVNKDAAPVGTLGKGDIPACGDVAEVDQAAVDADPADAIDELVAASTGTNGDGKCVIQVDAGSASGTADDAARGTHTITIAGPKASANVAVEIEVGGAPSSIESDAPERIDPSDELTINVTVLDDEDVRVGRVAIEVDQTAGDGKIITEIGTMTSDGRAKFTYLAPSRPGVAEFLVRTRDGNNKVTAQLPIIVAIAEEAPPEPPAPPTPEVSVSGQSGPGGRLQRRQHRRRPRGSRLRRQRRHHGDVQRWHLRRGCTVGCERSVQQQRRVPDRERSRVRVLPVAAAGSC